MKREEVWIECQVLTCDNDSCSVTYTVADYTVVFRYADEDVLIRYQVSAFILKGMPIFVYGGEEALGWHLREICYFLRIVARRSFWICLGETVMSRCGCMLHELWRNAKSVQVHFHVASWLVHCVVDHSLQFQLLPLNSVRL